MVTNIQNPISAYKLLINRENSCIFSTFAFLFIEPLAVMI